MGLNLTNRLHPQQFTEQPRIGTTLKKEMSLKHVFQIKMDMGQKRKGRILSIVLNEKTTTSV